MSKREVQKREKRILDMLPESTMTFKELSDWYLELKTAKKLASYKNIVSCLNKFNEVFGNTIVSDIKKKELESYQILRETQGLGPAFIDKQLVHAGAMVSESFNNDKIAGQGIKAFKLFKKKLKGGTNARKRTISYLKIIFCPIRLRRTSLGVGASF